MPTNPTTDAALAADDLRAELRRVLAWLARSVEAQRAAGREPASDPMRGVAIEENEAAGLINALAADLAGPKAAEEAPAPPAPGEPIAGQDEPPLRRLRRNFRLDGLEYDAVLLTLAVELDARFARLVAFLNDHIARSRPTVGLVLMLTRTGANAVQFCQRAAVRRGLLLAEGDGPAAERTLRLAPEFLARLAVPAGDGHFPARHRLRRADAAPASDRLVVAPAVSAVVDRWASEAAAGEAAPLLLVGTPGAGRATVVHAACARQGWSLVESAWEPDQADRAEGLAVAAREACWQRAVLLVRLTDRVRNADFADLWPALAAWGLPSVVTLPASLAETVRATAPVEPVVVHFQMPTVGEREALWQRLLPEEAITEAERSALASRYDFPPASIARAARRATAAGASDFESLARACREIGTAAMGPTSQRLAQPYTRADIVLPPELEKELDLAAAWMRNRRRVFEDWGFERRLALGRGLTMLFAGEPGTGKTMAAQVLAHELGMDLFRVDLSRVMSKYIGETEKNLSQLFDSAQASGAILFFDEADALFGKRTEVKDAHDRYANLEIGYLLQRMEEHLGTTVLSTNRIGDLDEAFTRRFHFILDFPMPGIAERRRIWAGMLPGVADKEKEIDLEELARDYEISGGEVRNSVLSAAFIAAEEGRPIGLRHLKRGLRRELLKTGRVLDAKQLRALEGG